MDIENESGPEDLMIKEQEALDRIIRNNSGDDVNPEIVVFMVEAIKFVETFSNDKLEKIAFETTMLAKRGSLQ